MLAAKLCGKTPPANTADVLAKLGLGAAPAPPALPAPASGGGPMPRPGSAGPTRPTPTATPVPTATATPVPAGRQARLRQRPRRRRRRPDRLGGPGLLGRRRHDREQRDPRVGGVRRDLGHRDDRRPDRADRRHQPRVRPVLGGRGPGRARRRLVHGQQRLRVRRLRPDRLRAQVRRPARRGRHDARSSRARSTAPRRRRSPCNRVEGGVDLPAIELQMFVRNCKHAPAAGGRSAPTARTTTATA